VADGRQKSEDVSRDHGRDRFRCVAPLGYHGRSDRYRLTVSTSEQRTVRHYPADRVLTSDPDSVRDGLDRLLPRLWRFCVVLSGDRNAAEDLVQATCLRALEREKQFEVGTRLDHWVFRIARSVWLNQIRADKVRRGQGVVAVEDAGLIDFSAETNLSLAEVLSEIMALPEAQRMTVLLVYVEGYAYKEAAEHLDIPIGTVMSRLASARGRLSPLRGRLTRDEGGMK
jgi:RNA polymerase sigma-70 factor (ECF subfamily)